MKNVFLGLLFVCLSGFAQEFPKDAVDLIIGKELGIKKKSTELQKYDFRDFYKFADFYDIKSKHYRKDLKFKYNDLINEKFILSDTIPYIGYGKKKYVFELSNEKLGKIYYDYDPTFNLSWIFYVEGGIKYPDGYWCKDITKKEDKFTSTTKYYSPSEGKVSFIKEKGIIYIYLNAYGKTLNVNEKGVIILLDDGSKVVNETAKIDAKVDGDGWYSYTTLFALSDDNIKKISNSFITDYRLYIYDFKLDDGMVFSEYLKCLKNKN